MTLQDRLDAVKQPFNISTDVSVASLQAIERSTLEQVMTNALGSALRAGDCVPDSCLLDVDGREVRLETLLFGRPLVLVFFRGGWCAYSAIELAALNELRLTLGDRDVALVAISQQTISWNRQTADSLDLAYPVLSDKGGALAKAFGLRWALPGYLQATFLEAGIDLGTFNGDDSWTLSFPARYVIDRGGWIVYADASVNHKYRSDPSELVTVLALLQSGRAGRHRINFEGSKDR
jgi:peroxiredoxin